MIDEHEGRLLILTDSDGSAHNPIVEALAESMSLKHCDVLTHWDICSRLAEADAACFEHVAETLRNGHYRKVLLIASAKTKHTAQRVAEAGRVLTERLEHTEVEGMVLHQGILATPFG